VKSQRTWETYIELDDSGNDPRGYINFVGRPANGEGRIDDLYDNGNALGRQPRANDDRGGSQYKDDCRDAEHEHMSWRVEQGSFGAGARYEYLKGLGNEKDTYRSILIEMKYTARNIPKRAEVKGGRLHVVREKKVV
jgi:hypothetical protein